MPTSQARPEQADMRRQQRWLLQEEHSFLFWQTAFPLNWLGCFWLQVIKWLKQQGTAPWPEQEAQTWGRIQVGGLNTSLSPTGPGSLYVSTQPSWWWLHSQDRSKMDTDMTFTQDNIERQKEKFPERKEKLFLEVLQQISPQVLLAEKLGQMSIPELLTKDLKARLNFSRHLTSSLRRKWSTSNKPKREAQLCCSRLCPGDSMIYIRNRY